MKKNKLVIFIVNGKAVEQMEGSEVDILTVESIKTNIAILHGVSYDEVEVDTQDVESPELSLNLEVFPDGSLMHRKNQYAQLTSVNGLSPALDISHEKLFHEFLDLITKKDYDNAIIFR